MASTSRLLNPQTAITAPPPLGFTENGSLTYKASGDPCLDFFFHVVPDTDPDDIVEMLQKAWDRDALTTLKLMFNLRGIRGTGKSNKEGFFQCALWLHDHHPNTLALNLEHVARFGCFKDLVELLFRLLEGPDVRFERKTAHQMRKKGRGRQRASYFRRKKVLLKDVFVMSPHESDKDDDFNVEEGFDRWNRRMEERRKIWEEKRKAKEEENKRMKEEKMKAV